MHKGLLKLQASHPYVVPRMWYVSWTTFSVTGILQDRNQKAAQPEKRNDMPGNA